MNAGAPARRRLTRRTRTPGALCAGLFLLPSLLDVPFHAAVSAGEPPLGGAVSDTIRGVVRWTRDATPHAVGGTLVIAPGARLDIEPGVLVAMGEEASILVHGGLAAEGTEDDPVRFGPSTPGVRWNAISGDAPTGPLRFEHCVIEGGRGVDWGWVDRGMIGIRNGSLTIAGCELRDGEECALLAVGSSLDLRDNVVRDFGDVGFSIRPGCAGAVQGNVMTRFGDDALNIDGSRIDVIGNRLSEARDDAVDFDRSTGILRGNVISGARDAALTAAGDDDTVLVENGLFFQNGIAFKVKDGARATIVNSTIADNDWSLQVLETVAGAGGGWVDLRSSIVWGNANDIDVDGASAFTAAYSDVQGEGVWPGEGNIHADPMFVDPERNDFDIRPLSPCVDAALSTSAPAADIHGALRYDSPFHPNRGGGDKAYYDIGSDEYSPLLPGHPEPPPDSAPLRLGPPFPNPFSDRASFQLDLSEPTHVQARILTVDGRSVQDLGRGTFQKGPVLWSWDGRDRSGAPVASGAYVFVIETAAGRAVSRRVVYLR